MTVGGRAAIVREYRIPEGFIGQEAPGSSIYEYLIRLDDGDTLVVRTDSERIGDYAAHKRVLDLMMGSLVFDG